MYEGKIKKTDPENKYRRVLAASTLAGDSVRNAAGEDLGNVDEIMVDIPSGRVAYAVVTVLYPERGQEDAGKRPWFR